MAVDQLLLSASAVAGIPLVVISPQRCGLILFTTGFSARLQLGTITQMSTYAESSIRFIHVLLKIVNPNLFTLRRFSAYGRSR